jgi:hypothetical protein
VWADTVERRKRRGSICTMTAIKTYTSGMDFKRSAGSIPLNSYMVTSQFI